MSFSESYVIGTVSISVSSIVISTNPVCIISSSCVYTLPVIVTVLLNMSGVLCTSTVIYDCIAVTSIFNVVLLFMYL